MRVVSIIAGLVAAGALLAATAAGYDAVTGRNMPKPAGDVPAEQARAELCAAVISADARQAAARMNEEGQGGGAEFATRNDAFRLDWIMKALIQADGQRDWAARVERLSQQVPMEEKDSGYIAAGKAYADCLTEQNRDPAFTEALHAIFGYKDVE